MVDQPQGPAERPSRTTLKPRKPMDYDSLTDGRDPVERDEPRVNVHDRQAIDALDDAAFAALLSAAEARQNEARAKYDRTHRRRYYDEYVAALGVCTALHQHQSRREARVGPGAAPTKTPAPGQAARSNPTRKLYDDYKGRTLGVPEWARVAALAALAAEKAKSKGARHGAVGNLILVLSQLGYWSEPDGEGEPRADPKWRECVGGVWWLVLRPAALGEQTGLGRGDVQVAVERLARLEILEATRFKEPPSAKHYGPKTQYVRLRQEVIEPLVAGKIRPPRRRPRAKKGGE